MSAEVPKFTQQITIDHGLSQSTVSSIYQADDGRIWFATADGISIFDGQSFSYIYRGDESDQGLQSNYTRVISQSPDGSIWVGTFGGGISVFGQEGEFLHGWRAPETYPPLDDIYDFDWDATGNVWIASPGGIIKIGDISREALTAIRTMPIPILTTPVRAVRVLDDGNILVGTTGQGLLLLNQDGLVLSSSTSENSGLSGSRIMALFQDSNGSVWVGTEDGGLNHYDPATQRITQPIIIPDIDIASIAEGNDGRLWFGSWSNGVFVYDPQADHLENYRSHLGQMQRLSSNTITALHPGHTGQMWLGTFDGGANRVAQYKDPFETYFPDIEGIKGPQSGVMWSFEEGLENDIWVGSKSGLSRLFTAENRFAPVDLGNGSQDIRAILRRDMQLFLAIRGRGLLRYDWQSEVLDDVLGEQGTNLFDGVFIRLLLDDRDGNLWVGTHSGVYRLNPDLEVDLHINTETSGLQLPHNRVRSLYEDPDGTIWIGTSGGLSRFDAEGGAIDTFSGPAYLADNDVRAVWRHPEGNLYVATQAGFSIFRSDMELIRHVRRSDGLPNETLYSLLPDRAGDLWITTNNGLVNYDPHTDDMTVYRTRDGLQGAEFNFNAHIALSDGRIVVGGINGLSIFDPDALVQNTTFPIVTIAHDTQLVSETAPATVSFDITVVHYSQPQQNRLVWKLDPVDTDWHEAAGTSHRLVRENLPSGTYTLQYRGVSAAGVSSDIQTLEFTVMKPWFLRWYAVLSYVVLAGGCVVGLIRLRTYRLRKINLALEAAIADQTVELVEAKEKISAAYREKSNFYARAAHEIRTPISLIKAPLQSIAEDGALSQKSRTLLVLVNRAVNRLTRLTDEMARVSDHSHELAIEATSVDLNSFLEPIISFYREGAQAKGLPFVAKTSFDGVVTFDVEAFELILHNLLSNALKYTEQGRSIDVLTDVLNDVIVLAVSNDAVLPAAAVTNLKATMPKRIPTRGSEIVSAMVNRAGGTIAVRPQPAEVIVRLPAQMTGSHYAAKPEATKRAEKPAILLIEDDRDLRDYLKSALADIGDVSTVASCAAARRAVSGTAYQLILCDVTLPDGSGFEIVQQFKEATETSHIPVIFLTAMSDSLSLKKGLEAWADDYITKPFDLTELKAKIRIRLRNIEAVRSHVRNQTSVQQLDNPPIALVPIDQKLVANIETAIAAAVAKVDYSIDDLAEHCAVSRRSLQRKIDALYGVTFSDLMAQRRMEHAAALLQAGMSIKDACRACGYSHASSFSRRFKQHFGEIPRDYRQRFLGM